MGYDGVMCLARKEHRYYRKINGERGDWLEVVKGCYEEANRLDGESFAGSMVFDKVGYFHNLRKLERCRILERDDKLSNKRATWWFMRDVNGVGRALRELGII